LEAGNETAQQKLRTASHRRDLPEYPAASDLFIILMNIILTLNPRLHYFVMNRIGLFSPLPPVKNFIFDRPRPRSSLCFSSFTSFTSVQGLRLGTFRLDPRTFKAVPPSQPLIPLNEIHLSTRPTAFPGTFQKRHQTRANIALGRRDGSTTLEIIP
jgi:hypothetical protein